MKKPFKPFWMKGKEDTGDTPKKEKAKGVKKFAEGGKVSRGNGCATRGTKFVGIF